MDKTHLSPTQVSEVTGAWVTQQMETYGIRVGEMAKELGIRSCQVSTWKYGRRPLKNPTKAMFFYYFMARRLELAIQKNEVQKIHPGRESQDNGETLV